MIKARTLVEVLEASCEHRCNTTFLEGADSARAVSSVSVHERALRVLHRLRARGAARGDKLILFLGSNERFVEAFWAAIMGGMIPVPVSLDTNDHHRQKLLRIAEKLTYPFIYSERRALDRVLAYADRVGASALVKTIRHRALFVDDPDLGPCEAYGAVAPEDIALIQFSSGSTSEPKGVVLTHANLIANIRGMTERAQLLATDISLSWMPLTHDFGLIVFYLTMFANLAHVHLIPTGLFVRRPLLWLEFASRIRASLLASPNFGYQYLLKDLGARPIAGIDLSSVRLIFNGAEPVSASLCRDFLLRLRPAKLNATAMYPGYGLAEACVCVSLREPGAPLKTIWLNRHRMSVGVCVEPMREMTSDVVELVAEGSAIPYCELRICGDDDTPLPDGYIGHVQIRGENVTTGYYESPEASAAAFVKGDWLRTGDIGVVYAGELYISGRSKEVIKLNGQNYYPHDIEAIAHRVAGVELGRVAAIGVRDRDAAEEQLVVFVVDQRSMKDFLPVASEVARVINEHAGLEIRAVVPIKRMPKTTSGKLQRILLRDRFLQGDFDVVLKDLG